MFLRFYNPTGQPHTNKPHQVKGTVRREHSCTSPLPSDQSPAAARSKELLPMPLSPTISNDWPAFWVKTRESGAKNDIDYANLMLLIIIYNIHPIARTWCVCAVCDLVGILTLYLRIDQKHSETNGLSLHASNPRSLDKQWQTYPKSWNQIPSLLKHHTCQDPEM